MTYDELLEAQDWAIREVHELGNELAEYEEDSSEWQDCLEALNDAENEMDLLQARLDTGDYTD